MSNCNRCGKCCLELGASFWLHSDNELIEAFGKRMPPDFYNDVGPCDMLVVHESGRTTCLLQKWLGHSAKPRACRDYPFDGEQCFGTRNKD
jgi:Fe-S-cluster containining protein